MTELLTPAQWLATAAANLDMAQEAEHRLPELAAQIAFHAQQCAELALKAVLIHVQADLAHTHELRDLLASLRNAGVAVPPALDQLRELTPYAVEFRYQTPDSVSANQARAAIALAPAALDWARAQCP